MTKMPSFLALLCPLLLVGAALGEVLTKRNWYQVIARGKPHLRHEHGFVKVKDRFYALGGRRIQPVDIFDPESSTWTGGSPPPLEIHHFQALAHKGQVLIAGAFTGKYPRETPVGNLYYYDPSKDVWSKGPAIPKERQRGSAGAFLKEGKLYLVSGLTDGHRSGWVPWFDEYDFESDTWKELPDAPRSRDHFQAVLIADQLVLAGGRRSGEGGSTFASVIPEVDVYDFATGEWRTLPSPQGDLPTPRAGVSALAVEGKVVVIGGESARRRAHAEVEAFDLETGKWERCQNLPVGRHATQPILHKGDIFLQAGSVTRGGTETRSLLICPSGGADEQ